VIALQSKMLAAKRNRQNQLLVAKQVFYLIYLRLRCWCPVLLTDWATKHQQRQQRDL